MKICVLLCGNERLSNHRYQPIFDAYSKYGEIVFSTWTNNFANYPYNRIEYTQPDLESVRDLPIPKQYRDDGRIDIRYVILSHILNVQKSILSLSDFDVVIKSRPDLDISFDLPFIEEGKIYTTPAYWCGSLPQYSSDHFYIGTLQTLKDTFCFDQDYIYQLLENSWNVESVMYSLFKNRQEHLKVHKYNIVRENGVENNL